VAMVEWRFGGLETAWDWVLLFHTVSEEVSV
jgi:hypothetical protein